MPAVLVHLHKKVLTGRMRIMGGALRQTVSSIYTLAGELAGRLSAQIYRDLRKLLQRFLGEFIIQARCFFFGETVRFAPEEEALI